MSQQQRPDGSLAKRLGLSYMAAVRIIALSLAALLSACASTQRPPSTAHGPESAAQPPLDAGAARIEEQSDVLEFSYGWPGAVTGHPALFATIQKELTNDRGEATVQATADRDDRIKQDFPFNPHSFSKNWAVMGETPRLLSLAAQIYSFQGGAHGNTAYDFLLWDKQADAALDRATVLPPALLVAVTSRYCAALDREREKKRGEPVLDRGSIFNDCPSIDEQVVAPADTDDNGLFDTIEVILAPYTAGPYSEGSYDLELPIDAATLATIPQGWRAEFEIFPQPR